MIDSILKAANKIKEEASEICDNVTKKLDTRKEIDNYKGLKNKEFEVAVPIYKASAGAVFSDEEKHDKYPARAMDRESHYEVGTIVKVVHAGKSMLFVEEAK